MLRVQGAADGNRPAYFKVVTFGQRAERVVPGLREGDRVAIVGTFRQSAVTPGGTSIEVHARSVIVLNTARRDQVAGPAN